MADDALTAALKQTFTTPSGGSFFPAANRMMVAGLEDDPIPDNPFQKAFGGGQRTPTPSPTPEPVKPTQMTLADLYQHFGVENPNKLSVASATKPIYQNKPDQQVYDWRSRYGWGSA